MKPPKINLLKPGRAALPKRRRFSYWKHTIIGGIALIIIVPTLFSMMSIRLINAANNLNPNKEEMEKPSLVEQMRFLVGTNERALEGEQGKYREAFVSCVKTPMGLAAFEANIGPYEFIEPQWYQHLQKMVREVN